MSEEKLDRKPAPAPYAAGTGSVPVGPDRAAFERMSYRERVAFKREDPEGYALMKAAAFGVPPPCGGHLDITASCR